MSRSTACDRPVVCIQGPSFPGIAARELFDRPDLGFSFFQIRPVLREQGVDSRPFWKPIHLQLPYRDAPTGALAVCEKLWQTILTLPCSTALTEAEQDTVIAAVRSCLAR